ncbi:MAG TPA: hypothetical protein PKD54_00695 [Pirellulaceae bacterium]|nr:hypothetical protein [Pirellulaceae bacterium]
MGLGIAIFVGIVGFVGLVLYLLWLYEKKRTQQLLEIAEQLGLVFSPQPEGGLFESFAQFTLFNQGRGRKIFNVMSGETDEVTICIFDYQYTTGSGKHQHTHKLTIASLDSPRLLVLPQFSMRPEGFFDRLGSLFGFQDINFDHHPEFSRRFVLKGPDEAAIRACFRPALLDYFASRQKISVEAAPGRLIYYRNSRPKVEDYPKLLEEAYQVFGAIVD